MQHNNIKIILFKGMFSFALCLLCLFIRSQQTDSTAKQLEKVVITDHKNPNTFSSTVPLQSLSRQMLQNLNAHSVGDAARYFSGAFIKDYGGVGGLKTISVRSLGASGTGILYDGIPVSDHQTGQIDLSRFSSSFIQSLSLNQGQPAALLIPARSQSYSSVLEITTNAFQPIHLSGIQWKGELTSGSFGLWQPSAGVSLPLGKNTRLTATTEALFSRGNYPYQVKNGPYSERLKRTNSAVNSLNGEINVTRMFQDSSVWQTKIRTYLSDRALPGSIIFFNPRSVQHLWNRDIYLQSRYRKAFNTNTSLLLSGKYTHTYTRYTDPDFQNGTGGQDSRYQQQEFYISGALSQSFTSKFVGAVATDLSYASLIANQQNFAEPVRLNMWNSVSLKYEEKIWQTTASLLHSVYTDKSATGTDIHHPGRLTPFLSFSIKPGGASPLLFRLFYKETFRIPTFNDLYYNFIGNRNLKPEYNAQFNFGLTYSKNMDAAIRRVSVGVDGYYNHIRDKIIAVPGQNLFNWSMFNLGTVHIKGVDVNAESNLVFSSVTDLFWRVAYTYQQAEDFTDPASATYKNKIPYTPDHSGSGVAILNWKDWSIGYSILFSGSRYAQRSNDQSNLLPSWFTHDVSLTRKIKFGQVRSSLNMGLNNITDQQFDVVRYFPMPGRNFKISISFYHL